MLDTEGQWSEALASNNIRAIIRWLGKLTAEGDANVEEILLTFSCWAQRTSEFAKKELLTLCFSRCQGQWMFLDRSSFTRVHMLLQRLKNLLTLAQWERRQLCSAHLWHGVGVPCTICRDTCGSSDVRRSCWNREHRALKQHIWLGRLVQWWGIMGLLPKLPEAQEMKRIAQMWKEMDHSHQRTCLEIPEWEKAEMGRFSSLIQGMVTQLDRQHGRIWTSEVCSDQCYPPPNLQALLKLVLMPRIDNVSVQAILMYFILDVANFLQCKDNLLQSFCNAFTIPPSFSQQIRAFWMFDHGHVKASMELLLSPRATVPWLSWQHRCILHSLLTRKQPQVALRYLQWTRPATETVEDAKLCADVLLQSGCVPDAWALLKRGHTESEDMLQTCIGITREEDFRGVETTKTPLMKKERPLCPLSAQLYRTQTVNTVSPEELLKLVRQAVMEVRKPRPKISELVWPQLAERKSNGREIFVSAEALHHLTPSPAPMDTAEETEQTARMDEEQEQPVIYNQQQPETQNNISSSEDLSSRSSSSFTSASSLPPLKQNASHVYQSTLTLQRISSLLTGGQNQSREEEEEESRTPSSTDGLSDCPELMLTPGGATDSVSLSSLNKDKLEELMLFAEGGEEDVFAGEDIFSVALPGPSLDFCVDTSFRLNLQHQPQSVPEILSPDNEKWACCKDVVVQDLPRVTPLCSSLMPLNKDNQSDGIPSQISLSETDTSDYFLEKKLSQKACEHQEELLGYASQDLSCTPPGTTRDLLTDYLNPGPTCNIKTTSAPSDATDERLAKSKFKTNEPRVPHTSAWSDHFKAGSWWEQSGLSCPTEPRAAITSDNKRPSLVLHQPYTQSQVSFMDFTAMQKGDGKQTEKEEPAGWSSLGKASQGVIRSGRTRAGKGKRVKRT